MRWKELIVAAAEKLADSGVCVSYNDAQLLAAHVLGVSRKELVLLLVENPEAGLEQRYYFEDLVSLRAQRFPLQYLTGRAPFRRLELEVGPGVFIPRPETESLAQLVIDRAKRIALAGSAPIVVDLGTGSAAIALSVAVEVPEAVVYAVELSVEAAAWARKNIDRIGVNVTLVVNDMATTCVELNNKADIVVSNPPYIPAGNVLQDPEVSEHEPAMALYGGEEFGMASPMVAIAAAARLLKMGGYFAMEHEQQQVGLVERALVETRQWGQVSGHQDLTQRWRFTSASKISRLTHGKCYDS